MCQDNEMCDACLNSHHGLLADTIIQSELQYNELKR